MKKWGGGLLRKKKRWGFGMYAMLPIAMPLIVCVLATTISGLAV